MRESRGHPEPKQMAFGYGFVDLSTEEKHARRVALDAHGTYLQLSVLLVLFSVYISFWISHIVDRHLPGDDEPPKSPFHRPGSQSRRGNLIHRTRLSWTKFSWWCQGSLVRGWGTRGQWIYGLLWTGWMLYLCVRNTAPDYWHLTKRFGMIPTAMLPFQYLLAMRSGLSPIQFLTRISHEELKAVHLILGRILVLFYVAHGSLYLNGFIQNGVLLKRLLDYDAVFGLTALVSFIAISTSALGFVRNRSYRAFYIIHVFLAVLLLEPVYFHCHHTHMFVWQTLVAVLLLNTSRLFKIRIHEGQLSHVAGSNLVQVIIPLNTRDTKAWGVGEHMFLSQVTSQASKSALYDWFIRWFHVNPFTIASLPGEDGEILLVARTLQGSTKLLSDVTREIAQQSVSGRSPPTSRLMVEGPYGGIRRVPDLRYFDTVLFVAGGVGATFTVPIYRTAMKRAVSEPGFRTQIRFIWAVRSLSDTRWAFSPSEKSADKGNSKAETGERLAEIFVTGSKSTQLGAVSHETARKDSLDDIEMEEGENLLPADEDLGSSVPPGVAVQHGRPDLKAILNDTLSSHQGRVAIFACGPRTLTDTLRNAIGRWVYSDRDIFYKAEVFGY